MRVVTEASSYERTVFGEGDEMRIGFVGAGKVGFTLGKYMAERGVCVSGYYSRRQESAMQASDFTSTKYYETLEELTASSDALFLTVPDGAIEEVWNSLKEYSLKGKFICHCSGAMSSAVFSGIDQVGAFGYSIHPLFAVHDRLQSYKEISQAYFTIEGSQEHIPFWKDFFEAFGNPVRVIRSEQKILYHSAAVFASNLVTGLFETGAALLMECGFDRNSAEEALKALFLNNCQSVAEVGPKDALTGPVERADLGTIQKHLDVLSGNEREIYARLSEVLAEIAEQKHPERDYTELSYLLKRSGKNDEKHSCDI